MRLAVAVAAVDGRLTSDEMTALERLDDAGFGSLSPLVREEIQRAMHDPIDVAAECARLRAQGPHLTAVVFDALAAVAESDGVSPAELDLLRAIATRLEVPPAHAMRVLGPYFEHEPRAEAHVPPPATPQPAQGGETDELRRARAILGVGRHVDRATADAAYLALVERYDPARVIPLGPDFVVIAVRRLADVTAAYQELLESGLESTSDPERDRESWPAGS